MLALVSGLVALCLIGGGAYLVAPELRRRLATAAPLSGTIQEGMAPAPEAELEVPDDPWPTYTSAGAETDASPAPGGASPPSALAGSAEDTPTRVSRLRAGRTTTASYHEAYAEARAEMDEAFDYVQFRRVFAPGRFQSPDSIRAARRMVAAAGNILRVYRGREVMLEQTYRPDDPGGRGTLREPFETAETARALVAEVDSLFGILVAQQGRFQFDGSTVRFADARTARLYSELRRSIQLTLGDWRRAPEHERGVTIPRLILALGTAAPPPAR